MKVQALLLAATLVSLVLCTGCGNEQEDWEAAKAAGTITSVESYLRDYPDGGHVSDAQLLLDTLYEDRTWEDAKLEGTIASLEGFVQQYPESRFHAEADVLLKQLHEHNDWIRAKDINTIESLTAFCTQNPSSTHADEAQVLLAPLREAQEWAHISERPSAEALEAFIHRYPQSVHLHDAHATLRAVHWGHATVDDGKSSMVGVYMDGYLKHISALQVDHDLSCRIGSAKVAYTVTAGEPHLLKTRDGRLLRNGTTASAAGEIVATGSDGVVTTTKIVGIIWAADENLLGSYVYSYDTYLGMSNFKELDEWEAVPPIDRSRAICALKIRDDGTLAVTP